MVTAATIYLSLLGHEGLKKVALAAHQQTRKLAGMLLAIDGVSRTFSGPFFHESVLSFERPVAPILEALAKKDILGGFDLSADHPELPNALLICATETKTDDDLQRYADAMAEILK
jgi:glycine dehydrogenase subunit 1